MTSLQRKLTRKKFGKPKQIRPQYTIMDEEGGYITLHPTKGWKRVSAGRIRARQMMMEKFGVFPSSN